MAVLAMTPEVRELREQVRELMDRLVYPNEPRLDREDDEAGALVKELRAEVRAAGLWAPHIGPEAGGSGRGFVAYAFLNELIGRSAEPGGALHLLTTQATEVRNDLTAFGMIER